MITLIAAMDEDRLIGLGEELPWRLPEEQRHFRETTTGYVVVMGRKTWLSMAPPPAGAGSVENHPRILPERVNYVVTRDADAWAAQIGGNTDATFGPHFVPTVELAISNARKRFPDFAGEIFILGGREIYELVLRRNLIDRMLISHVRGKHIGDVYFPPFGEEWVGRSVKQDETFEVIEYVRKP
jgi:dihydrofolate reductase